MPKFIISVPELYYSVYAVEAETKEEAFDAIDTGENVKFIDVSFYRTFDKTEKDWIVESEEK